MRHFLFVLLCTLPVLAGAQTLTEAEALRLGLSRAELHDLERGTRALAEADVTAAGTWPNPTLDYERERMRTSGRANDQTWKIAQTFDISGRRGLREAAAGRRICRRAGSATELRTRCRPWRRPRRRSVQSFRKGIRNGSPSSSIDSASA